MGVLKGKDFIEFLATALLIDSTVKCRAHLKYNKGLEHLYDFTSAMIVNVKMFLLKRSLRGQIN